MAVEKQPLICFNDFLLITVISSLWSVETSILLKLIKYAYTSKLLVIGQLVFLVIFLGTVIFLIGAVLDSGVSKAIYIDRALHPVEKCRLQNMFFVETVRRYIRYWYTVILVVLAIFAICWYIFSELNTFARVSTSVINTMMLVQLLLVLDFIVEANLNPYGTCSYSSFLTWYRLIMINPHLIRQPTLIERLTWALAKIVYGGIDLVIHGLSDVRLAKSNRISSDSRAQSNNPK